MEPNYDNFADALSEICSDKINPNKLRSMFKEFDSGGVEPKVSFESIENFKASWRQKIGFRRQANAVREIKDKWEEFAIPQTERRRSFASSNAYVVHHVVEGKEQSSSVQFADSERATKAIEWIDGDRITIYESVFGVPCQKFNAMAPWESERWLALCIELGYEKVKRVWTNFCQSENSFYHCQPGLMVDKIWQSVGALNRGPVHDGENFESVDLKEPEKLA